MLFIPTLYSCVLKSNKCNSLLFITLSKIARFSGAPCTIYSVNAYEHVLTFAASPFIPLAGVVEQLGIWMSEVLVSGLGMQTGKEC
jgi:hypothetical protein